MEQGGSFFDEGADATRSGLRAHDPNVVCAMLAWAQQGCSTHTTDQPKAGVACGCTVVVAWWGLKVGTKRGRRVVVLVVGGGGSGSELAADRIESLT